jgi:hypothetical protein
MLDHHNDFPVVFCTPDKDPPGRPDWNPTVSFYCPLCKYRHEHGNPFRRTEPGQVVGSRVSHCHTMGRGPRLSGEYVLVIGEEQWRPVRRRSKKDPQRRKIRSRG